MARLLPLLVIAVGVYLWYRSRHGASAGPRSASPSALTEGSLALGFLPASGQNTERARPDAELDALGASVRAGEWEPTARALAAAGKNWERRSQIVGEVADAAANDDAWLTAWEAARPDDPDAAVVRAKSTVFLAWEMRGSARADSTSQEQFDGFHRVLMRSRGDIERAKALNPEDPTPYITEVWTGLGLGYPHETMRELWAEITARAPHHYAAHYSALQYWSEKWRGSEALAWEFVEPAIAAAPHGTLLPALRLVLWYEHHDSDASEADYREAGLTAYVDAVLADIAMAPPTHPRLAEVRHLLAYFLVRQKRHAQALEQFRMVDGYVEALPWRYYNDPAAAYCAFRDKAVRKAR
ncbi:hypothetical protein [Streptomyces griseocarneus]|uniref:hypothetical protein n=1 Tax=Streptomyces griseocarneus TaxID=51201 RepID=UPI00167CBCA5|nr:hypothetical protein [Streptomyces griseocarneus]MBZ6474788.1 hypothetical protein [Streptomyces griseocarneus]GHG48088.1 hypothetical protein GCM10018779_06050 [Streptomyces griseocarneus]